MSIIFIKTKLSEVSVKIWKDKLLEAKKDNTVGISHSVVSGNTKNRIHVASIEKRVGAHFHKKGEEDYLIVQGNGLLHYGKKNKTEVVWEEPIYVKKGDNFIIPENYAHQLESISESQERESLIILFSCPDSHLSTDREMVENSPFLKNR